MTAPNPALPATRPVSPDDLREDERYLVEFADRSFIGGPRSRWQELKTLIAIMRDFLRGLRKFHFAGPCVTIFGSARIKEGHPYYEMTRKAGAAVADLGFTVMTGGGPGLMEAASRGAKEAGGRSVGINIILPFEQKPNDYLDACVDMEFFFTRKTLLIKYSYAFIVMPGGLGTMDELFEALTLIQTGKIKEFPVILMGTAYWQPIVSALIKMRDEGLISPGDLDLLRVTDSIEDAMQCVREKAITQFNLRRVKVPKSLRILGERSV
jgi:uncharacterized protein (TIGR00730 family)